MLRHREILGAVLEATGCTGDGNWAGTRAGTRTGTRAGTRAGGGQRAEERLVRTTGEWEPERSLDDTRNADRNLLAAQTGRICYRRRYDPWEARKPVAAAAVGHCL